MRTWPHGDPSEVVKHILAQPAYRAKAAHSDAGLLRFWYEIWSWIDRLTRPFWDWLGRLFKAGHGVATPLTYVVVTLTVALVIFVLVRLALAFVKPAVDALGQTRLSRRLAERRSAEEWQRLAAAAAADRAYGDAIVRLFAAALAALDERMVVAFDPSRTAGEYRLMVRNARIADATSFDTLSERFVHAAFSTKGSGRADYDAAIGAYQRLWPTLAGS